jgi:anti-anti-sigma factor
VRITVQIADSVVTVKLEGRFVNLAVSELQRIWQELIPFLSSRKLSLDLRGLTFMDSAGRHLLAEIYANTGANFLANTPMTKYFAEEAARGLQTNSQN